MDMVNRRQQIKLAIVDIMAVDASGISSVDLIHIYLDKQRPFYDTVNSTEFLECLDDLVNEGQLVRDGAYYHSPTKTY